MPDDGSSGGEHSEAPFGEFSIEGLEDPLSPHAESEYVELVDADPPPADAGPDERLPGLGARPWSGPSQASRVAGGVFRGAAVLALVVLGGSALVVLGFVVVWVAVHFGG